MIGGFRGGEGGWGKCDICTPCIEDAFTIQALHQHNFTKAHGLLERPSPPAQQRLNWTWPKITQLKVEACPKFNFSVLQIPVTSPFPRVHPEEDDLLGSRACGRSSPPCWHDHSQHTSKTLQHCLCKWQTRSAPTVTKNVYRCDIILQR